MLSNAKQMLRYDPATTVVIEQAELWKEEEIKEMIQDATTKAKEIGTDVIVLLDMDLEWGPEWEDATEWAGKAMNTISAAYSEIVSDGKRIVDAHSAGAVAFAKSLIDALANTGGEKKLFDEVFLSNGRTSAKKLSPLLEKCGYTAEQIKLFLNKGDWWAAGAIAKLEAVKAGAGKFWTVYFAKEMSGRNLDHGVLIDKLKVEGRFEVYDGGKPHEVNTSVHDIKMSLIEGNKNKSGKRTDLGKSRDRRKKKNDDYFKPPDFPPPPPPPPKLAPVSPTPKGGVDMNIKPTARDSSLRKLKDNILRSKPFGDSVSYPIKFDEGDKP
jgi:hypothetical protein